MERPRLERKPRISIDQLPPGIVQGHSCRLEGAYRHCAVAGCRFSMISTIRI
jgi:hypothetical protein